MNDPFQHGAPSTDIEALGVEATHLTLHGDPGALAGAILAIRADWTVLVDSDIDPCGQEGCGKHLVILVIGGEFTPADFDNLTTAHNKRIYADWN
jgi:hypothetical protein